MLLPNPNKNAIKNSLEIIHKGLALYSSKYENFIVLGDFSLGVIIVRCRFSVIPMNSEVLLRSQHPIKSQKIHPAKTSY